MALARALVPVAAPPVRRVVRRSRRRSRSRPRACPGFRRVISAWLCSDCALAFFLLRLLRRRAAVLRSGAFFLFSCFLFFPLLHARFRISKFMLMYSIFFPLSGRRLLSVYYS